MDTLLTIFVAHADKVQYPVKPGRGSGAAVSPLGRSGSLKTDGRGRRAVDTSRHGGSRKRARGAAPRGTHWPNPEDGIGGRRVAA